MAELPRKVRDALEKLGPPERLALLLVSTFPPDHIDREWVEDIVARDEHLLPPSPEPIPEGPAGDRQRQSAAIALVARLESLGLVAQDREVGFLRLAPRLGEWVASRFEGQTEIVEAIRDSILDLVSKRVESTDRPPDRAELRTATAILLNFLAKDPKLPGVLPRANDLLRRLVEMGEFRIGRGLASRLLEILRDVPVPGPERAALHRSRARSLAGLSQHEDAAEDEVAAISLLEEAIPRDEDALLDSYGFLADRLVADDIPSEALAWRRRAVDLATRRRGPESPDLIAPLALLADTQREAGDLSGAARSLQRAIDLESACEIPPSERPTDLLRARARLLEEADGDLDAAIRLEEEAIELDARRGTRALLLPGDLERQAELCLRADRVADAIRRMERSLALTTELPEGGLLETSRRAFRLGEMLQRGGDHGAAEEAVRMGLENARALVGENPEIEASGRILLARIGEERGRMPEARRQVQQGLKLARKSLSPDDPLRVELEELSVRYGRAGKTPETAGAVAED